MKGKSKQLKTVVFCAALLLAVLMMLNGCKKSEPAGPAKIEETSSAATEQTTCPVMGGAVNKDIFTEYRGKKVYFCCPGCKETFEKDPEKYLEKLPQFKE